MRLYRSILLLVFIPCISTGISGCTTAAKKNQGFAEKQDLHRQVLSSEQFGHVAYLNQAALANSTSWNVYIEGDGVPWLSHKWVASDPTTPLPLMLRLMSQDSKPALYLARPCYEGLASEAGCSPWLWTHGRYSRPVVESMLYALNILADKYGVSQVTLIGHSGGGTMAMLMAPHSELIRTVITIASNLDVKAWAERNRYSSLLGSLDPADQPELTSHIEQYHYLGRRDRSIPLEENLRFLESQSNTHVVIVDQCGHQDCWEDYFLEHGMP